MQKIHFFSITKSIFLVTFHSFCIKSIWEIVSKNLKIYRSSEEIKICFQKDTISVRLLNLLENNSERYVYEISPIYTCVTFVYILHVTLYAKCKAENRRTCQNCEYAGFTSIRLVFHSTS